MVTLLPSRKSTVSRMAGAPDHVTGHVAGHVTGQTRFGHVTFPRSHASEVPESRFVTHDTSTACTMRQPRAQRVNLEHNASTSSTTRQPRAQCVNREHNASTASTTRQPRAQRVNRVHNALLTHVPYAQRIACVHDASPGIHNASTRVQQQRRRSPLASLRRVPHR